MNCMRQGMGTALLYAAMKLAMQARGRVHGRALWLTTYQHLRWNRPYYEHHGFVIVAWQRCGEQLRDEPSLSAGCCLIQSTEL
jgi:hypothetical protein